MRPEEETELRYDDTRFGWALIALSALFAGGVVLDAFQTEVSILHLLGLFGIFVFMLFFFCLRVAGDRESVSLIYGIGILSTEIDLCTVESFGIAENRSLKAWLYYPFTKYVLELKIRGGGRIVVPSPDPKRLSGILRIKI